MPQQRLSPDEMQRLQDELRAFREEKEKIRAVIGQIGGKASNRRDRLLNVIFILLLLALFGVDLARHVFSTNIDWLPSMVSLEIGVLLVSLKIIWMIHKQARVEHFQFWILNSIEFRLNEMSRRMDRLCQADCCGKNGD